MNTFSFGFTTHLTQADPDPESRQGIRLAPAMMSRAGVDPDAPASETRAIFADPEPTTYVGNGGITTQQERPKLWGAWTGPQFHRPAPVPTTPAPATPSMVLVGTVHPDWLRSTEAPKTSAGTRRKQPVRTALTKHQQVAFIASACTTLGVTRTELGRSIGVRKTAMYQYGTGCLVMPQAAEVAINALLAAREAQS